MLPASKSGNAIPMPSPWLTQLRAAWLGAFLLAASLSVQAECSKDTSPALSRRAVEFVALATPSASDTSITDELLDLQSDIRCGDADAIATLKPFLNQPDTGLLAAVMLVDAGQWNAIELLGALERAPLALERKAELLEMAADWPSLRHSEVPAATIVRRTEWAFTSGDEKLSRIANELRAMHGDAAAIAEREERLMSCAELPDGGIGSDCLGMHELHTAPSSLIETSWGSASMPQRFWLARWARRTQDSQAFLLSRLPAEDSKVQYQILIEAMEGGETREYAVKAALALIQQAATDSSRHPRNIPINFSKDYREGMFGIAAYEPGEDYPITLQAAFDELATYPYEEAASAMQALVLQDHPWLATQAGIWLVRHGHARLMQHALRYTLEDDGLPPVSVLNRIHPIASSESTSTCTRELVISSGNIPPGTYELFLSTLENGALGKWKAFAEPPFDTLLDDHGVIEAIMSRIARLPSQIALEGIDITLDAGFESRMKAQQELKHELEAYVWAMKASGQRPNLIDRYIHTFEANRKPMWQALAMAAAMEFGRKEVAQRIAHDFVDAPLTPLRAGARKILGMVE